MSRTLTFTGKGALHTRGVRLESGKPFATDDDRLADALLQRADVEEKIAAEEKPSRRKNAKRS